MLDIATMLALTATFEVGVLGEQLEADSFEVIVELIFWINVAMLVVLGTCAAWDLVRNVRHAYGQMSGKGGHDDIEEHYMPTLVELQLVDS